MTYFDPVSIVNDTDPNIDWYSRRGSLVACIIFQNYIFFTKKKYILPQAWVVREYKDCTARSEWELGSISPVPDVGGFDTTTAPPLSPYNEEMKGRMVNVLQFHFWIYKPPSQLLGLTHCMPWKWSSMACIPPLKKQQSTYKIYFLLLPCLLVQPGLV